MVPILGMAANDVSSCTEERLDDVYANWPKSVSVITHVGFLVCLVLVCDPYQSSDEIRNVIQGQT